MKKESRKRSGNPGLVTAFVLVVLFVLSVLGFAFGSRGSMALSQAYVSRQYMQAFYAAQAGIMTTIMAEQETDITNPTTGVPTNCGQITSPASLTIGGKTFNLPYTLPDNAKFSITITNNTNTTPCPTSPSVTAPDGTPVPVGSVYITSKGTAQGKTRVSNVMVPVTFGSPPVNFNYGIFAATKVNIQQNGLVDSYDSQHGPYGGSNVGNEGNIGTNSAANGSVTLANNSVAGQVAVGPGGTPGSPTIAAGNNAHYNGALVLSAPVPFPTVTVPNPPGPPSGTNNLDCPNNSTCTLSPGAYGTITAENNATIVVPCGNYSMSSIDLLNNVALTVNCTVPNAAKLYVFGGPSVTNPIDFSPNVTINSSGVPSTFQLYDVSSATGCSGGAQCQDVISNNNAFYGAFYSQNAGITIKNNGEIYGAVVGSNVTIDNNGAVHYDEELDDVAIGQATTPTVVGNFTIWNFQ